jgi:NSS family neurotransmitter:Na+ symporter
MRILGEEEANRPQWRFVGLAGVFAGFLILSYYSVIAGWTLSYIFKSGSGAFSGIDAAGVGELFGGLVGSAGVAAAWHTGFMAATIFVVAKGVEKGLERAVRVMVPALIFIMMVLLGYAITAGDFAAGIEFMFRPDFEALTGKAVLAALGQAFFSLSVGMGAVMAYGAYLPQETSITSTAVAVVSADTGIAILAGVIIFPIVFANGLDPAEGPGLVFNTLPLAFGQMAGGTFFGMLFFLLLSFAALTSAISLMEPAVAWFMESRAMSRGAAATLVGGIIWALGFATVLSFNLLADFKFLNGTLFDNLDFLTSNIMLPLGGLFITVFAGWIMCSNSTADELDETAGPVYRTWRILARSVAPIAVILIFLNAVGLI